MDNIYSCGRWYCHRASLHSFMGTGEENTGTEWIQANFKYIEPLTEQSHLQKGDIVTYSVVPTNDPNLINHSTTANGNGLMVFMSNYNLNNEAYFLVIPAMDILENNPYSSAFIWRNK